MVRFWSRRSEGYVTAEKWCCVLIDKGGDLWSIVTLGLGPLTGLE